MPVTWQAYRARLARIRSHQADLSANGGFYLAPVHRIVPGYQPAVMSAVLMFKILVPFILSTATL